ncbi:hypothetical protein HKX48_004480 [Thoreauomyces humboldtii]|nr:hypothetical protein HKX48_004480 [Thoreauomyces humboldtii]
MNWTASADFNANGAKGDDDDEFADEDLDLCDFEELDKFSQQYSQAEVSVPRSDRRIDSYGQQTFSHNPQYREKSYALENPHPQYNTEQASHGLATGSGYAGQRAGRHEFPAQMLQKRVSEAALLRIKEDENAQLLRRIEELLREQITKTGEVANMRKISEQMNIQLKSAQEALALTREQHENALQVQKLKDEKELLRLKDVVDFTVRTL